MVGTLRGGVALRDLVLQPLDFEDDISSWEFNQSSQTARWDTFHRELTLIGFGQTLDPKGDQDILLKKTGREKIFTSKRPGRIFVGSKWMNSMRFQQQRPLEFLSSLGTYWPEVFGTSLTRYIADRGNGIYSIVFVGV